MSFVVDASIAAAWFLPYEHNDTTDRLLRDRRVSLGVTPSLLWLETRNLFLTAESARSFTAWEVDRRQAVCRGDPARGHRPGRTRDMMAGRSAMHAGNRVWSCQ